METNRLNITSVTGYGCLLLQFNYTWQEMGRDKDAFRVFKLLLTNGVRNYFDLQSRKLDHTYAVPQILLADKTSPSGFCISVSVGGLTEDTAKKIVHHCINYALHFDLSHHRFRTDGLRILFENNLMEAKHLVDQLNTAVFTDKLVAYASEYWSPFEE